MACGFGRTQAHVDIPSQIQTKIIRKTRNIGIVLVIIYNTLRFDRLNAAIVCVGVGFKCVYILIHESNKLEKKWVEKKCNDYSNNSNNTQFNSMTCPLPKDFKFKHTCVLIRSHCGTTLLFHGCCCCCYCCCFFFFHSTLLPNQSLCKRSYTDLFVCVVATLIRCDRHCCNK